MISSEKYLFISQRLGFRAWLDSDLDVMAAICNDKQVMEFFPKTLTRAETLSFIKKMQALQAQRRHCYFAVELLESQQLIGFIGLGYQTYNAPFTPMVDIGWRLSKSAWGYGYATEGALRTLLYAKEHLKLHTLSAAAPKVNLKSIRVMDKIGMQFNQEFLHPAIAEDSDLNPCVLYDCII